MGQCSYACKCNSNIRQSNNCYALYGHIQCTYLFRWFPQMAPVPDFNVFLFVSAPSSRSSRTTSSQFSTYRSSLCSLDSSTTTSCFVCDYVAAKDRAETNRSTDRLEGTSVRKPGTAHITDVMEAYKHSDAFWQTAVKSSMCVPEPKPQEQQHSYLRYGSPSSVHERRRRSTGSPYWLRSGASAEPSQEEVSGEQIASTVAELRQLVAASEATRQDVVWPPLLSMCTGPFRSSHWKSNSRLGLGGSAELLRYFHGRHIASVTAGILTISQD